MSFQAIWQKIFKVGRAQTLAQRIRELKPSVDSQLQNLIAMAQSRDLATEEVRTVVGEMLPSLSEYLRLGRTVGISVIPDVPDLDHYKSASGFCDADHLATFRSRLLSVACYADIENAKTIDWKLARLPKQK